MLPPIGFIGDDDKGFLANIFMLGKRSCCHIFLSHYRRDVLTLSVAIPFFLHYQLAVLTQWVVAMSYRYAVYYRTDQSLSGICSPLLRSTCAVYLSDIERLSMSSILTTSTLCLLPATELSKCGTQARASLCALLMVTSEALHACSTETDWLSVAARTTRSGQ